MRTKLLLIILAISLATAGALGVLGFEIFVDPKATSQGYQVNRDARKAPQKVPSSEIINSREARESLQQSDRDAYGIPTGRRVSAESVLVSSNGLRIDAIDDIIAGDRFDQIMAKMHFESNADALELTNIYRENLAAHLKTTDPRFTMDRIACGSAVCMAAVTGNIRNEQQLSDAMTGAGKNGEAPIYSAVMHMQPGMDPDGFIVYRVVFAIDSNFNALTVPRR